MAISFNNEYKVDNTSTLKLDVSIENELSENDDHIIATIMLEQHDVIIGDTLIKTISEEVELTDLRRISTTVYTVQDLAILKQALKDIIDTIDKFQKQIKK